jgi:transcription antitermination factor NusG
MVVTIESGASLPEGAVFPAEYLVERWYAVQTCANHEKRALEQPEQRSVQAYLQLYGSVRRWEERSVRFEPPLFPGYVFVQLAPRDRLQCCRLPALSS